MLVNNLQKFYDQVHSNLLYHQEIQNTKQHIKAKLRNPRIGDEVYLDNSNKFKRASQGPFKIIEKCSDVIFKIQLSDEPNSRIQKVHINRLLPITERKKHLVQQEAASSRGTDATDNNPVLNPPNTLQTSVEQSSQDVPTIKLSK